MSMWVVEYETSTARHTAQRSKPMYRIKYQGATSKIKASCIMAAFDAAVRQYNVTQENRHRVTVLPLDKAGRVIR